MLNETEKVTEISEEVGTTTPPAKVTLPTVPVEKPVHQEKPLDGLAGTVERISQSIPQVVQTKAVKPPPKPNVPQERPRKVHQRPSRGFD